MRRLILASIIALSSTVALMAQTPFGKGKKAETHKHEQLFFVGGALNYWYDANSKESSFAIHPEFGYLFNDKWGVGAFMGYEFEDGAHKMGITPFVRYYYHQNLPFKLYMDGCVGFNYLTKEDPLTKKNISSTGFEVGVRPGACVDLTEGLCLCLRFGFVGYRNNFHMAEEPGLLSSGFGVRFAPEELQIGLELEF